MSFSRMQRVGQMRTGQSVRRRLHAANLEVYDGECLEEAARGQVSPAPRFREALHRTHPYKIPYRIERYTQTRVTIGSVNK